MKKRWAIGTLKTDAVEILRCRTNESIEIDSIHFVNYTTGNSTVFLYHVPDGEVVSDEFHLVRNQAVNASDALRLVDQRICLMSGDTLHAYAADANKISAFIYGQANGS